MTLLEKIKYEVEEELGNPTEDIDGADLWVDEIAKRYARAILERAAENAEAYMAPCGDSHQCACMGRCDNPYAYVSTKSILNTDLE